jgi:hypothetical protein
MEEWLDCLQLLQSRVNNLNLREGKAIKVKVQVSKPAF